MKYVAVYKCRLCGELETVGPHEECDCPISDELAKYQMFPDCNMLLHQCGGIERRIIGGSHTCEDGNAGIMEFAGIMKVDE